MEKERVIEKMEIRLLVYIALGYWAAGETIYKNKVLISTKIDAIFLEKLLTGFLLGFILIPIAVIKLIMSLLKK